MTGRRPGSFSATVELCLFECLTLQRRQWLTTTKKQPVGGNAIVTGEKGEPREFEHAGVGVRKTGVHVPSVDAVAVAKRFLATDSTTLLQEVESLEETMHDGSGGRISTSGTDIISTTNDINTTTITTTNGWRNEITGRHIAILYYFNFYQTGRRRV